MARRWIWDFGRLVRAGMASTGDVSKRVADEAQRLRPQFEGSVVIAVNSLLPRRWFDTAWRNASLRLCADGGANRVLDFYSEVHRTKLTRYTHTLSLLYHAWRARSTPLLTGVILESLHLTTWLAIWIQCIQQFARPSKPWYVVRTHDSAYPETVVSC